MTDHQKSEAKRSLWDRDGQHIPKRYRNRGRARGQDRQDIRAELHALQSWDDLEREFEWAKEIDEALYCHHYGPCAECLAHE